MNKSSISKNKVTQSVLNRYLNNVLISRDFSNSSFLLLFLLMLVPGLLFAQDQQSGMPSVPPPPAGTYVPPPVDSAAFVNAHNEVRAAVGLSNVSWNKDLEKVAEGWVRLLEHRGLCFNIVHNMFRPEGVGENGFATTAHDDPRSAVNSWYEEKQFFDNESNSCQGGKVCGHYKQMVVRDSTEIGCAEGICRNTPQEGVFSKVIICNYSKEMLFDQKPY